MDIIGGLDETIDEANEVLNNGAMSEEAKMQQVADIVGLSDEEIDSKQATLNDEVSLIVNNTSLSEDEKVSQVVSMLDESYPLSDDRSYEELITSISNYENTSPLGVIQNDSYITEFRLAKEYNDATGLEYYTSTAYDDYGSFSNQAFSIGSNTQALSNVAENEENHTGIATSNCGINQDVDVFDYGGKQISIDDSCGNTVSTSNENYDSFDYSYEFSASEYIALNAVANICYSEYSVEPISDDIRQSSSFRNMICECIEQSGFLDGNYDNGWSVYQIDDKQIEEIAKKYEIDVPASIIKENLDDGLSVSYDQFNKVEELYQNGNFTDAQGILSKLNKNYGVNFETYFGVDGFNLTYDPEKCKFVMSYSALSEEGNFANSEIFMHDIIDKFTTNFDEYSSEDFCSFYKNNIDKHVAYSLADYLGISNLQYNSENSDILTCGYDVETINDTYFNSTTGGNYGYNGFQIYHSGNINEQVQYVKDNIDNYENQEYDYGEFGFFGSILIDQENSELDEKGVKRLTSVTDQIVNTDGTTEYKTYYQFYLKNGQYVTVPYPEDDAITMDYINDCIDNSSAMKNYKLYDALTNYYGANAAEIDVKYSEYSGEYHVYINGELTEISEEEANVILTNAENKESLGIDIYGLPSSDAVLNNNKTNSGYIDNFHRSCISINDDSTYDDFINELDNKFKSDVETCLKLQDSTFNAISSNLKNSTSVESPKEEVKKDLNYCSTAVDNLTKQIKTCLNLLNTYDVSLKTFLDDMINDLFGQTNVKWDDNNAKYTSELLSDNSDTFLENFIDKEIVDAETMCKELKAIHDGYVVLAKEELYDEDNHYTDKYKDFFDESNVKDLGNGLYGIKLEYINTPENDGVITWAYNNKNDDYVPLASSIQTLCTCTYPDDAATEFLKEKDKWDNYYNYTSKFAKTIISQEFADTLDKLEESGIQCDLLSTSELALYMCESETNIDTIKNIVEISNKSTNYNTSDAIRELIHFDNQSGKLVTATIVMNEGLLDDDLINSITNNTYKERVGYVSALKLSNYLLSADDNTVKNFFDGLLSADIGFENGLESIDRGLWHIVNPDMTTKEYFMQYLKSFLNPLSQEQIESEYANNQISLNEYNFRTRVNNDCLNTESNTYKVITAASETLGQATAQIGLSMASIACPALAPYITAIQVLSGAGYNAQQYYMQSGMTTGDAWKARFYGLLKSGTSYLINRGISSYGNNYQRFDIHGNAFFGTAGGNMLKNYAEGKGKQVLASGVSDVVMMAVDYLFGTDMTLQNSTLGLAISASENGYVGQYSNNFWYDYVITTLIDAGVDISSDALIQYKASKIKVEDIPEPLLEIFEKNKLINNGYVNSDIYSATLAFFEKNGFDSDILHSYYESICANVMNNNMNIENDISALSPSEQAEYYESILASRKNRKLYEAKLNKSLSEATNVLDIIYNHGTNEGYFDPNVALDAKVNRYSDTREIKINGVDYTMYFPSFDKFYTDKGVFDITCKQTGLQASSLEDLAIQLKTRYDSGNPVTVTGTIFQNAASGANNLVKFGGNIGRSGAVEKYGAYILTDSPENIAKRFSYCCHYDSKTNDLIVDNYRKFGEDVLGGVPLSGKNGIFQIQTIIPVSNDKLCCPSVNNLSAYIDYFAPGAITSGGMNEMVMQGVSLPSKNNIIEEVSAKDGTKYNIYVGGEDKHSFDSNGIKLTIRHMK